MNTILLALRNLLRNRRRSMTTVLAMIIGASAILLFGGYSRNIRLGLQTGFVQSSGHLQIQHTDYFLYGTGNPGAYGIENPQEIIDVLKKDPVLAPMLNVVTPVLHISGIAGNFDAGLSRTVIGSGVVVADQNKMRLWNDYNFPISGKPSALTGTAADSAVIGVGVARVLQLCNALKVENCKDSEIKTAKAANSASNTGSAAASNPATPANTPDDISALSEIEKSATPKSEETRIEMLASNPYGAPNVASLKVVKAAPQGVKELDDMYIGMHLAQAQRLVYGREAPKVTAIALQLQHTDQIPAASKRLRELLDTSLKGKPLEFHDYTKLNPTYGQIVGMFSAIFGFISMLIGSIVLFTVSNTMSMAVVERTVEIGTLRAIGLRQSGIRSLFVSEGMLLGLIGSGVGATIAVILAAIINSSGMTWTPPGQMTPIALTVRVWGETNMIFGTALGLMLVAVISAWWPAKRAAKMNIVEALRHV